MKLAFCTILFFLLAPAAKAVSSSTMEYESEKESSLEANVSLTSDYIFRGVTLSDHKPALQGGADWKHPEGYRLGLWGSNIQADGESRTGIEMDLSGGYTYAITQNIKADAGVVYYAYILGKKNSWDIPIELSWKNFKIGAAFAPQYKEGDTAVWYLSAGYTHPIEWKMTLGIAAGYSIYPTGAEFSNYADFKLSLSREFYGVGVELAGVLVDHRQFAGEDDPRIALTLMKAF